jgi:hypothetical protein
MAWLQYNDSDEELGTHSLILLFAGVSLAAGEGFEPGLTDPE